MNIIFQKEKNGIVLETFPVGDLAANCTLLYSKESKDAVIFDAGNSSKQVIDALNSKGLNLKLLIHTHAHFDHIGDSSSIKEAFNNAPMYLNYDDVALYNQLPNQAEMFGISIGPISEIDVFFNEETVIELENSDINSVLEKIKILHTPGHSQGSCCFFIDYFDEPVLIAGDTLFQNSIGRTDLPGGSHEQIIHSIKNKLLSLPDNTEIITGHGPCTSLRSEKQSNPFIA